MTYRIPLIFGDIDGVIVIPQRVEAEVIELALAKASVGRP
jgi:regulator of RNase E activity RraA